jgi:hypothetical protein
MDPIESTRREDPVAATSRSRRLRPRRALGVGCLALFLVTCAILGALVVALQSGPVEIALPGNSALKFGSDNFVLSNSSFQNGTTYYADFKAIGIRDILEIHDLKDTHSFEIVLHQATKDEQKEQRLLAMPSP